jgi:hypothetical protein
MDDPNRDAKIEHISKWSASTSAANTKHVPFLATGRTMAPQSLLGELAEGGDGAHRLDLKEEPPRPAILTLVQEMRERERASSSSLPSAPGGVAPHPVVVAAAPPFCSPPTTALSARRRTAGAALSTPRHRARPPPCARPIPGGPPVVGHSAVCELRRVDIVHGAAVGVHLFRGMRNGAHVGVFFFGSLLISL